MMEKPSIIEEDHSGIFGLFKFILKAVPYKEFQETEGSTVKLDSKDTTIVQKTLAGLDQAGSSVSDQHLRHKILDSAARLRDTVNRNPERIETTFGSAIVRERVELGNGSVILRRGGLDPDESYRSVYLLEAPSKKYCAVVVSFDQLDARLIARWLADENVVLRWKESVRDQYYDMTGSDSVPEAYRFRVPRHMGPVRNFDGAYYLLEIAGTPREPLVIATYLIRNGYAWKSERSFFGPDLFDRIAETLVNRGYLQQEARRYVWTRKLMEELGQAHPEEYSPRMPFIESPHGEITELTDFKKWGDAQLILCSTNHRGPDRYAQDAARWGSIHDLYHSIDGLMEATP
jgi:hypothetical protein